MVSAGGMMLVVAEMVAHLRLERGLEHLLGQLVQQPAGADKLDPLLPRLRQELLGKLLLIHSRHSCRRSFVFCCGCCHVTDRVSHGLPPLGFQTSQFNRSADSPPCGAPQGGRLVGSGPTLGLGVTNEGGVKLRECARPRVGDGSPALIFDWRHGPRSCRTKRTVTMSGATRETATRARGRPGSPPVSLR